MSTLPSIGRGRLHAVRQSSGLTGRYVRSRFCRGSPSRSVVLDAMTDEKGPWGMLTKEDDVEIQALAARGWSVSAISPAYGP